MDNNKLLGSTFEMSLRILLMLNELKDTHVDEQRMCAIDFMAVYAADFNILDENLHAYGNYRFSEYPARKFLVSTAIKDLVLSGAITFLPDKKGFLYKISETGEKVCNDLDMSYAAEYRIAIRTIAKNYDLANANLILNDINQHIIRHLEEDYHE